MELINTIPGPLQALYIIGCTCWIWGTWAFVPYYMGPGNNPIFVYTLLLAHLLQTLFETLTCLMVESPVTRDGEPQVFFESMESQLWGRSKGKGKWKYLVLCSAHRGISEVFVSRQALFGKSTGPWSLKNRVWIISVLLMSHVTLRELYSSLSFGFSIHKMGISWSLGENWVKKRNMKAWHPKRSQCVTWFLRELCFECLGSSSLTYVFIIVMILANKFTMSVTRLSKFSRNVGLTVLKPRKS